MLHIQEIWQKGIFTQTSEDILRGMDAMGLLPSRESNGQMCLEGHLNMLII